MLKLTIAAPIICFIWTLRSLLGFSTEDMNIPSTKEPYRCKELTYNHLAKLQSRENVQTKRILVVSVFYPFLNPQEQKLHLFPVIFLFFFVFGFDS